MNKKGLYPQLNDDQKASITIYTMESQPPEDSVSDSDHTIITFFFPWSAKINSGISQSQ